MRLHEHQAKELFATAGVPTPAAQLAETPAEAVTAAAELGFPVFLKAQVRTGGRAKAGGIERVEDEANVREAATRIFDADIDGHRADSLLVETAVEATTELYVGVTMDRSAGRPVAMVSTRGGVDIETVAADDPGAIEREQVDPAVGLFDFQARRAAFEAGVDRAVAGDVAGVLTTLYELWERHDGVDAEINPLLVTDDEVVAVDAVFTVDDDALFRQPELAEMGETAAGDDPDRRVERFDYVRLDGTVGVVGNGAGLVMATLDLVEQYGGTPANFLDIGGGAGADRVADALDIVFDDDNAEVVLFNIFGGITRGDEVATGINRALDRFETVPKPVVVRLAGTNAEAGREILDTDRVRVEAGLEDAVRAAVTAAGGKR